MLRIALEIMSRLTKGSLTSLFLPTHTRQHETQGSFGLILVIHGQGPELLGKFVWPRSTPSALFPASSSLMASESPCSAGTLQPVCCPYTRLFQVGHSDIDLLDSAGLLVGLRCNTWPPPLLPDTSRFPFFWKFFRTCQATLSSRCQVRPAWPPLFAGFLLCPFFFLRCSRFRSSSFSRISRRFSLACKQKCLTSCHKKETLPPRLRLEQLSTAHVSSFLLPSRQPCALVLPACTMFTPPLGLSRFSGLQGFACLFCFSEAVCFGHLGLGLGLGQPTVRMFGGLKPKAPFSHPNLPLTPFHI